MTLTILNVDGKIYYMFNLCALAPQFLFFLNYLMVYRGHKKPFEKLMVVCLFCDVMISCIVGLEVMFEWWDQAFTGAFGSIVCILLSCVFTLAWSVLLYQTWKDLGYKEIVDQR